MHRVFLSQQEMDQEKKLNDLAFELDYMFEQNVGNFAIYSSLSDVPMYDESYYDSEVRKELGKVTFYRYFP